jgi:hypothetical protein
LASNGGYPEVDKYRGLGTQIFSFHLNMVYVVILHINQAEMNSVRVSGISYKNNLCNLTCNTSGTSKKGKILTLFSPNVLDFLHLNVHSPSPRTEFVHSCQEKKKVGSYQGQNLQC